jgi:hypothetical protein
LAGLESFQVGGILPALGFDAAEAIRNILSTSTGSDATARAVPEPVPGVVEDKEDERLRDGRTVSLLCQNTGRARLPDRLCEKSKGKAEGRLAAAVGRVQRKSEIVHLDGHAAQSELDGSVHEGATEVRRFAQARQHASCGVRLVLCTNTSTTAGIDRLLFIPFLIKGGFRKGQQTPNQGNILDHKRLSSHGGPQRSLRDSPEVVRTHIGSRQFAC